MALPFYFPGQFQDFSRALARLCLFMTDYSKTLSLIFQAHNHDNGTFSKTITGFIQDYYRTFPRILQDLSITITGLLQDYYRAFSRAITGLLHDHCRTFTGL